MVEYGSEAHRVTICGVRAQLLTKEELLVALFVSQQRFEKLLERMNRNDLF
jgi:hypothetical protein